MVGSYVTLLGGSLHEFWVENAKPLIDTVLGSHYFWPGVAVVAVGLYFLVRK